MEPQKALIDKTPEEIRCELRGFPSAALAAALTFRLEPTTAHLEAFIVGVIGFYLPKSLTPPDWLPATRFREDLGIDSLTLTELVFKLDELFGIPIETREVIHLHTVGELQSFLRDKLHPQ